MQFAQFFTLLATASSLALGTPVEEARRRELSKRECNGSGESWGDKHNTALDKIGKWCGSEGGAGDYRGGQTRYKCYNFDDGRKIELWVQNTGGSDQSLSSSHCNEVLQKQVKDCEQGGSGESDGWYYR